MSERSDEPLGEYVRRRMKVQLGDGPDQRGEVTVEVVRDADADSFADFALEVERARQLLANELDLDESDAEVIEDA